MYKHKYVPVVILLLLTLIWAVEGGVTQTTKKPIQTDAITIPNLLNYQGKLTNLAGNPVTDSSYSITFRLFTTSSGGSALWNETQNVQTHNGLFNVLLGSVSLIDTIPQSGNCYLEMQVNPNAAMTPRIRIVSSAYAYLAKKADSANYAPLARPITPALTTSEIADGAVTNIKLGADAVTTDKILNGTILRADVVTNFKAPYSDTADYARASSVTYVDSARVAVNAYNANKIQGKDTTALSAKFVDEGQPNAISSGMIFDSSVTMPKINQAGATIGQVIKWTGAAWVPRNDSVGIGSGGPPTGPAGGDLTGNYPNPQIAKPCSLVANLSVPILYIENTGTGDAGYFNGNIISTGKATIGQGHVNSGAFSFIAGKSHTLNGNYATICGGQLNRAYDDYTTIGGGYSDSANGYATTIAGGYQNNAIGSFVTVGGGQSNVANGNYATISGGNSNSATLGATVSGGVINSASSNYSTVGGGYTNAANGVYATVSGGFADTASGGYTTVSGGYGNIASGQFAIVGGGVGNIANGMRATISGGNSNVASSNYVTISGGDINRATKDYATIGGGYSDSATGYAAIVCGGYYNKARSDSSTVGGGARNTASGIGSTICGGRLNTTSGNFVTISGGQQNFANGTHATISGGSSDTASGTGSVIGGGFRNNAIWNYATIGGGEYNKANNNSATIGGGYQNLVSGIYATIAGGIQDSASGHCSSVGGGYHNNASGDSSVVSGGTNNKAINICATVSGGWYNNARGQYSTVPGGYANTASGSCSFATGSNVNNLANYTFGFGRNFTTSFPGAVIFYDRSTSTEIKVGIDTTSPSNILTVRKNSPTDPIADAWGVYSSRRWKENIRPIDNPLEKVQKLNGVYFNWKDSKKEDIGLIAEDVGKVFPQIVTYEANGIDAQGLDYARLVALLIEAVKAQQNEINTLKAEIEKTTEK